jgi:hypothetical protein
MTTPTPSELRALDLFMAEKVMGWKEVKWTNVDCAGVFSRNEDGEIFIHVQRNEIRKWNPTESPADAMMVLKRILNTDIGLTMFKITTELTAIVQSNKSSCRVEAPSLELAICLFAREVCS